MSGFWFAPDRILDRARRAAVEGLDQSAKAIAIDAKRRAPIRKVFKRSVRRFRPLTEEERAFAIARARHYYTYINPNPKKLQRAVAHLMTSARVELRVPGDPNALVRSRSKRVIGYHVPPSRKYLEGFRGKHGGWMTLHGYDPGEAIREEMTPRALADVRRGVGVHFVQLKRSVRVQMGGALKASIHATAVRTEGSKETAMVAASIYYAKFVEFPTIRTAAQPFLRPAMFVYRERLAKVVAEAWRRGMT
jgi:hypothetical protein